MPNRYPQEAVLRDGRRLLIRPFAEHDADALHDFFMRLPEMDHRLAWDHIDDRQLVEAWARNIDYGKVFPLLAIDAGRIVADMTLHRRAGGPLRLTGRIKWLIDPDFRGVGLGSLLVNHFIGIARANGLRHLICMLFSDSEKAAIRVLSEQGFTAYHFPTYGTDLDGEHHDMTKMVLEL